MAEENRSERPRIGRSALLSLLFLLVLSTSSAAAEDAASLVQKVQPSVLLILERKPSGEVAPVGSGFLVSADGKLVTNAHGSDRAEDLYAEAAGGRIYRVTGILERDSRHGRELLQLDAKDLPFLRLSSPVSVREGEPVTIVSSRFIGKKGMSLGTVLVERSLLAGTRLRVMTPSVPRLYAGSPVVGEAGQVLGVATAEPVRLRSGNFVIAVATIGSLAISSAADPPQAPKVPSAPASAEKRASPTTASSGTTPSTVAEPGVDRELLSPPLESASGEGGVAWELLQHGEYAKAAAAFGAALHRKSSDARLWLGFGLAKRRLGETEEARTIFRQATRLNPTGGQAWRELGEVDLELKQYGEAAEAFEQAVRLRPRDARGWLGVAAADLALQKRPEAEAALDQVRALGPKDAEIWIGVAKVYSRLGRPGDAAAAYQQALDRNPKDARALLGLGLVSIELGRTEQAEQLLSRLLEVNQQMGMELVEALKKR